MNLIKRMKVVYCLTKVQKSLFGLVSSSKAYPKTIIGYRSDMMPALTYIEKIMQMYIKLYVFDITILNHVSISFNIIDRCLVNSHVRGIVFSLICLSRSVSINRFLPALARAIRIDISVEPSLLSNRLWMSSLASSNMIVSSSVGIITSPVACFFTNFSRYTLLFLNRIYSTNVWCRY